MNKEEYLKKGKDAFESKRLNHAIEYFQAVLDEEFENEEANMGLALVYLEMDNLFKAKRHLFRVLSNDPNNEEALNHIRTIVFSGNMISNDVIQEEDTEEVEEGEKNFRVANWGDSFQKVERLEGAANLINTPGLYAFEGEVASMPCTVLYSFTDNKLSMGKYIFNVNHSNNNDYIYDYEELVDLLSNKYGNPTSGGKDNAIWLDDLFRDDYSGWGTAIASGQLVFDAAWDTPETEVLCQLRGDNYEISLVIQYVSKNLSKLREETSKKNKMRGL